MAQKDKVKELVGRGLGSYHTKALQQIDRIEKKNKEQNHKINILTNELDNDYLTKTEEGSVISLDHSKEGMVYLDELQGNTLVNYCVDGSKELTLNGDIDVEGTNVTLTEGVDNGLVDIICEGNTLVNLNKRFSGTQTSSWDATNSDYVVSVEGHTVTGGVLWYYTHLKPSTTYTMVVNILECTNMGNITLDAHYSYPPADTITFKKEVGVQKIVFNTKDSFERVGTSIKIATYGNDTTNKLKISKQMILLEGDWTNKEIPQYFEGMKSVGECENNKFEILSNNKNLFDKNSDINFISNLGTNLNTYKEVEEDYIRFKYGGYGIGVYFTSNINKLSKGTYTLSCDCYCGSEDSSKTVSMGYRVNNNDRPTSIYKLNSYNTWEKKIHTFTISEETDIEGLIIQSSGSSQNYKDIDFRIKNIQLERNAQSTEYIPYALNKKEISLNEPLRSVGNTKDKIVKIGGKWYIERNCAEVIFDGSDDENWGTWSFDGFTNGYLYRANGIKIKGKGIVGDCSAIADKTYKNIIYMSNSSLYDMTIHTSTQAETIVICDPRDINTFKQDLVNNPITVTYLRKEPIYEPLEIEPTLNTYTDITHISNNSTIPCTMKIKNSGYNAIIKPSTQYTVALDTNKSGTIGINLGGAKVTTTNNVATITTPATLTDDSLRLHGKDIKASKVRLLEGDKTNWTPSHFEGMKSSFEDKLQEDGTYKMEILSNNKNLFNFDKFKDTGSIKKENGALSLDVYSNSLFGIKLKDFCDCLKLGETYKFSLDYDKNGGTSNVVSGLIRLYNPLLEKSITLNNPFIYDEKFLSDEWTLIFYGNSPSSKSYFKNIQLEKSSISSNYTPHKSNKIQFLSIEPLRGVSNVKDKFVFKDNKLMIERNCGSYQVNLDTVHSFNRYSAGSCDTVDTMLFSFTHKDGTNWDRVNGVNNYICDISPCVYGNLYNDYESIWLHDRDIHKHYHYLRIHKSRLNTLDVEGFKKWLSENPIELVYQLEEPTYEEIPFELQKIILEGYENGTLFFNTNIPPTSTVTYAGETPIVKSVKLNKTEVLNNTNDINDNIVPYLMDMDYRVVCLQLQSENINDGVSMARLFGGTYEMLQRDIQSKRYSVDEYNHRLDTYLSVNKITHEEYTKLGDMLNG